MKNSTSTAQVPLWRQQLHYRLKEGALIALGALGMAAMFRSQVMAAGEGTDNMKTIANFLGE